MYVMHKLAPRRLNNSGCELRLAKPATLSSTSHVELSMRWPSTLPAFARCPRIGCRTCVVACYDHGWMKLILAELPKAACASLDTVRYLLFLRRLTQLCRNHQLWSRCITLSRGSSLLPQRLLCKLAQNSSVCPKNRHCPVDDKTVR